MASFILPGVHVNGPITAIFVAIVLAFLNAVVRPIMILLTIPATIVTLGLFLFVINVLIVMIADFLVEGLKIKDFGWAAMFSFVVWISTMIMESLDKRMHQNNIED